MLLPSIVTFSLSFLSARAFDITGVQAGVNSLTGERPLRLEFSTFQNTGPAFDLYILAFQQFQQSNQTELLSYFQIAGIHGYPYVTWDDVEGPYNAGYCTHSSILFLPWHRPYMALFEQIIWDNAQTIASTYPPSQLSTYQEAALTLRIPYWDWAYTPSMPDAINSPTITINTPDGTESVWNPLYNYTFHPQDSEMAPRGDPLIEYPSTLRYPDSYGQSQPNLANNLLVQNGPSIHSLTYELIASQPEFGPFSNTGWNSSSSSQSLENLHNSIHGLVGMGGHMTYIPWSSYDPIFWLHHANVDRLFAIWQAIYPDSYVVPESDVYGTMTNAPGSTEDVNTPLTPFHLSSSTMYTSASARALKDFGYTYPEIQDWNVTNATTLSEIVRTKFNDLYNPTGSLQAKKRWNVEGKWKAKRKRAEDTSAVDRQMMDKALNAPTQWSVSVQVDESALPSTFFVDFYLSSPSASAGKQSYSNFANTSSQAGVLVGTYTVFSMAPDNGNGSSVSRASLMMHGTIPLTYHLIAYSGLPPSLDAEHVVPYLTRALTWSVRLTTGSGDIGVSADSVKGLVVTVVKRVVAAASQASDFPRYGAFEPYHQVTAGKAGGWKEGEDDGSTSNSDKDIDTDAHTSTRASDTSESALPTTTTLDGTCACTAVQTVYVTVSA